MSLEPVEVLFEKEPMKACRLKAALDELLDEGFYDETIWNLYKAFLPPWEKHTKSKS